MTEVERKVDSAPVTQALERAIDAYGGVRAMAEALGVSEQAVYGYWRVPAERVEQVVADTGIPRWELRPDLYWPEH